MGPYVSPSVNDNETVVELHLSNWVRVLAFYLGVGGCGVQATTPTVVEKSADPAVASWGGETIRLAEVEARVQDKLREIRVRYELDRHAMLSMALDAELESRLLDAETRKHGLDSVEALLAVEVDGKVGEPAVEDLREAFVAFQQQVPAARFEEASAHLAKELRRVRREERYREYLAELRRAADVQLALPYPNIPAVEVPIRQHDPQIGPDEAEVTLVQFAEFQCYYCRQVAPNIDRLMQEYEGSLRVVFKDFPLRGHSRAREAARAAGCAGRQDRYWPLAQRLFEAQAQVSDESLRELVQSLGLDVGAWSRCISEPVWDAYIDEDVRDGMSVGVTATPTIFVNGVMVAGAQPYERLAALVEQQLGEQVVAGR